MRSRRAGLFLKKMGYQQVANLEGGTNGWTKAGHPVEVPTATVSS
jgi:rhodanese-related sulfurtransferase